MRTWRRKNLIWRNDSIDNGKKELVIQGSVNKSRLIEQNLSINGWVSWTNWDMLRKSFEQRTTSGRRQAIDAKVRRKVKIRGKKNINTWLGAWI